MSLLGWASLHPMIHTFSRRNGVMSALSITGSSYQAERLEHKGLKKDQCTKSPIHSRQLGLNEMQLSPSSKHISQNAHPFPKICTLQSKSMCNHRTELWQDSGLWTELTCQLLEIHDLKLQLLLFKRETDSNVWFMTCLNFFPFHHITVTVYRKYRAVCVGCTWPVRINCM